MAIIDRVLDGVCWVLGGVVWVLTTATRLRYFGFRKPEIEALERKKNVEILIMALEYPDYQREAQNALVRIGAPAVPQLVPAVKYEDQRISKGPQERVRNGAQEALIRIGAPAVNPLVNAIKSDPRRSALEIRTLKQIRDPAAVTPLIAALKESDLSVIEAAATALGKVGDPRAIGPLKSVHYVSSERFAAEDSHVRASVLIALKDLEAIERKRGETALNGGKDPS